MSSSVYLPSDEFAGTSPPDLDLAADYLELSALFAESKQALSGDIVNGLELAAETEFEDVNVEMETREDVAAGAVARMQSRQRALGTAYPFELDDRGEAVYFAADPPDFGQTAYLVSLLLSNLRALSPLLNGSDLHPSEEEVRELRQYFQYFATAAIAAEIGGRAWSFGFPRPDGTGFIAKLTEIWNVLKDGTVTADPAAPNAPKDDQVDIFAWREQRDGLPGFLLVAAQVATGADWKNKSIKSHISRTFPVRWFAHVPATEMVAYHVIPFARPDGTFRDDVLVLGNVLHRIRVPRRVAEADTLARAGLAVEAFDQLDAAVDWLRTFLARVRMG